jgi:hypothetical protein
MIKLIRRYRWGIAKWETMTTGELINQLKSYPPDTPVMATWEGVLRSVTPDRFQIEDLDMEREDPPDCSISAKIDCLVIDVDAP